MSYSTILIHAQSFVFFMLKSKYAICKIIFTFYTLRYTSLYTNYILTIILCRFLYYHWNVFFYFLSTDIVCYNYYFNRCTHRYSVIILSYYKIKYGIVGLENGLFKEFVSIKLIKNNWNWHVYYIYSIYSRCSL